jgi:hypothetical protein
MSNTELWDKVFKTDPQAVKPITGKSYQGNSPKPYWLIKRATEVFGACGDGWGINVISSEFTRISETDLLHTSIVEFWHKDSAGNIHKFQQAGGTKASYMTKDGKLMVDEDAAKKSVTDGMVKCMSMLGFAGDIFSGRWDDSKYVAETNAEFRAAEVKTEPKISEAQFDELGDLILETKADQVKFNQAMKIETLSQLPASKFSHAKMLLEKKRSVA